MNTEELYFSSSLFVPSIYQPMSTVKCACEGLRRVKKG